jgi:antitoxin MazE
MVSKIHKWGNSQGLRLPKHLLEEAHLSVGDDVEVTVRHGEIRISKLRRIRGKVDLGQLVESIPADYRPEELEWGGPMGREAW